MRGQGFTPTGSGQDLIRRLLAYSGMWSWTIERMFNHDALSKDASVKKKCFSSSSDLVLWHTACFGDIARAKQIATALSTLHTPEVSEAQVNSSKYFNSAFSFCNFAHYCFFAILRVAPLLKRTPLCALLLMKKITLLKQFCMCSDGVSAIGGLLATVVWI